LKILLDLTYKSPLTLYVITTLISKRHQRTINYLPFLTGGRLPFFS